MLAFSDGALAIIITIMALEQAATRGAALRSCPVRAGGSDLARA